jgi:hypothetical protein
MSMIVRKNAAILMENLRLRTARRRELAREAGLKRVHYPAHVLSPGLEA